MKKIFVKTKNIKAFIALMDRLTKRHENMQRMGLVYGEPGLGKTNAILWWALQHNAVIVTAKNGMSTRWFLSDLVTELGETPQHIISHLFEQAVNKLIERPRVLIVDEVDYLTSKDRAIETIRDLHDRTGIPVLMVGMGYVDKKLSRYKHLFDRIIEIYKFTPFDEEDIQKIVQSLSEVKVTDEVLSTIKNRANRFRQIVKIINRIENIAETNSYKVITNKEIGEIL